MIRKNKKTKSFTIDARAIIHLGRDNIKNPTTAILELVKNSYDADATTVEVSIGNDYIRIADNGIGMNEIELEKNWLRIGFSEKRDKKISNKLRRKTGEKGIGRLSTDRLGKIVNLSTVSKNKKPVQLIIDWDKFDVDGKELSQIPITMSDLDKVNVPISKNKTGTEVLIANLRQNWVSSDMEQIHRELSAMVSPFSKVHDFNIIFHNFLLEDLNGPIESNFQSLAEVSVEAVFDGSSKIKYKIIDRSAKKIEKYTKIVEWSNLSKKISDPFDITLSDNLSCGPVSITLLFFQKTPKGTIIGDAPSVGEIRDFLKQNAGVKIYRDDISVKPYGYQGEPYGDWLGLGARKTSDPAGLKRPSYKVAPHQLVGVVSISRDKNPMLKDSASREGLVESVAFNDMRALVLSCVSVIEGHRHKKYLLQNQRKITPGADLLQEIESYNEDLKSFAKKLESLKKSLSAKKDIKSVKEITDIIKKTTKKSKQIEDLLDNNRVLAGLATVGISLAVFGHETQTAVSSLQTTISSAKSALTVKSGSNIPRAIKSLKKAMVYAKQVSSWGSFAMTRISRDKRIKKEADVHKVIAAILFDVEDAFRATSIDLVQNLEKVSSKLFLMDIESIILNLLTNSYSACLLNNKNRKIAVSLKKKKQGNLNGFEIAVSDSGPGVDKSIKDLIWTALYTTKRDGKGNEIGTGLGLYIVRSTVEELGGKVSVGKDPILGGARFSVWLPSV